MAKAALDELAKAMDAELYLTSDTYRSMVSDFLPHVITIDEKQIIKESQLQLEKMGILKEDMGPYNVIIKEEVPKLCKYLYDAFDPKTFNTDRKKFLASDRKGSPKKFTFQLAAKLGEQRSVFGYFRTAKQKAQADLIDALDKQLVQEKRQGLKKTDVRTNRKTGISKEVVVRDQFLAIGHADATAVATQRALQARKIYSNWFQVQNEGVQKLMKKEFGGMFVKIKKSPGQRIKDLFTGGEALISTVEASIESDRGNKSKAFTDAKRAGNLQKELDRLKILKDSQKIADLPGSDSPLEVVEKAVNNTFHQIGSKKGRRKTNIKKQKINNASSTGSSKPRNAKPKRGSKFKNEGVVLGKSLKAQGGKKEPKSGRSTIDFAMLMGAFNRDLAPTVEKNMGFPRLESRTGRFASSTKVTDIMSTAKGYPSIGYTYQKNPYQTFETGYKQGSVDRDPRKLIDASIREIALQFAMGRFFTRRV